MPDSPVDIGQIIALAGAAGLAKQKLPQHIELVDDLPRTASGKVKKDILRKRIKAQMSAS
jgi:non-ribosomal peptide synthetase component E (peptide arylation enzyme)